jgi:4-hydroxy-tetrahydrodipicolinate reductase
MRICMAGAYGRMGRRILELAAASDEFEIGGAFDTPHHAARELVVGAEAGRARTLIVSAEPAAEIGQSDVLIDFTVPEACVRNVSLASDAGKPSVVGTTGLTDAQLHEIALLAKRVPIVLAPNFSVGVNLLFQLVTQAARVLGLEYNCEIVETHHNQKHDSPSGTALRLAERVAEGLGLDLSKDVMHGRHGLIGPRPQRQIGVHALRGGDVAGDHTVSFIGPGERIELTHRAHTRDNFARGALRAAAFAVDARAGLYDMQDVLGLK